MATLSGGGGAKYISKEWHKSESRRERLKRMADKTSRSLHYAFLLIRSFCNICEVTDYSINKKKIEILCMKIRY